MAVAARACDNTGYGAAARVAIAVVKRNRRRCFCVEWSPVQRAEHSPVSIRCKSRAEDRGQTGVARVRIGKQSTLVETETNARPSHISKAAILAGRYCMAILSPAMRQRNILRQTLFSIPCTILFSIPLECRTYRSDLLTIGHSVRLGYGSDKNSRMLRYKCFLSPVDSFRRYLTKIFAKRYLTKDNFQKILFAQLSTAAWPSFKRNDWKV
jgi:hypothetical protein